MKFIFCRGLPSSGKTTWANKYVEEHPNTMNVCKDDIRREFPGITEKFVIMSRNKLITDSLKLGKDVISSDTNYNPIHENKLKEIAVEHGAEFEIKEFDTPLEECIRRNKKRPRSEQVPLAAITEMYYRYVYKKPEIQYDPNLPDAYIFDIDGTLANHKQRDVYNTGEAGGDIVIEPVKRILLKLIGINTRILFCSGRDEKFRDLTDKWLDDNGIMRWHPESSLFMRPAEDVRPDFIIKREIYDNCIKNKFNVLGVFEDRKQIKRMWRDAGLFVFDVNQNDSEF